MDPGADLDLFEKRKLLSLLASEPRVLGFPARSLVTILTGLSQRRIVCSLMNNRSARARKEEALASREVLFGHLSGQNKEGHETCRTAGV